MVLHHPGMFSFLPPIILIIFLAAMGIGYGFGAREGKRRKFLILGRVVLLVILAAMIILPIVNGLDTMAFRITLMAFGMATLVGLVIGMGLALFVQAIERGKFLETETTINPANMQDRQMILDMLRDGKVSGEQAAELLKALGPKSGPADRLPLTKAVIGAVGGAMLIVIGFMLPWVYVRLPSAVFGGSGEGYQAGYHVGFLGWLILILGTIPALLVCIPSLDKHVRLGLLHVVIACIGGAFVISLLVKSSEGIGLWVAGAGFAVQLLTAFRQAGIGGGVGAEMRSERRGN